MTAPSTSTSIPDADLSLIDLLLREQRDLTAVERFAQTHQPASKGTAVYRSLIPLSKPRPGEQYAFTVDLDRCSGCKACVSACHSLNGLDENELWRGAGAIVSEESPYLQTITSSCHHCVDPACAAGCPVLAYEKDPDTGIVRHLDDQCIGCQYCILKCPYDVPKYSKQKGIVRKCDLCSERLATGETPACAQACPHEAIRVEIVNQTVVKASALPGSRMIPGAFDSSYTAPATRYASARPIPASAKPVRARPTRLEEAHWPLIVMLILTQCAAGLHLIQASLLAAGPASASGILASAAAIAAGAGLFSSVFHLGRPLKAWRAFLGWRRSWMSREILAFGLYSVLASFALVFPLHQTLAALAALSGTLGVYCSAMIYIDTRRPGWGPELVFPKFFGAQLLLGTTAAAALCGWFAPALAPALAAAATVIRSALFVWERKSLLDARHNPASPGHAAALTAFALAPKAARARTALFAVSTAFSLLAIANWLGAAWLWGTIACIATFTSQGIERWLFFAATPAPRMPNAGIP